LGCVFGVFCCKGLQEFVANWLVLDCFLCNKTLKQTSRYLASMRELKKLDKSPPAQSAEGDETSEVDQRRLELLKLEGLGLSRVEMVKQSFERFGCSQRTVYNDLETRASWQPMLQSVTKPEDVQLKVANRYEWIYRQASIRIHSSSNESVQLGALNTMLKANSALSDALVLRDLISKVRDLEQKAAKGVFVP